MKKGTGTVRKRGNTWYYRYYDENGKRVEKAGGTTKTAALKKLNEEVNLMIKGVIRTEDIGLIDFLEMWVEDYIKDERSENTYYKYKGSIEKIATGLGNLKLDDLKVIHIEKYLRFLKKSGLNSTSVQFHFGVLKNALNKAIKLQMLNDNPCKYIDTPKREKFKANILTLEEFYTIYNSLNNDVYEDYIFKLALDLSIETGLRRGEMAGLPWSNINFTENYIIIDQALIRIENEYKISKLKTESSYRKLPISESLTLTLKEHKKKQQLNKLKYGEFYNDKYKDLVFTWENGNFIIPSNFLQRIKRLCKYHGIEKNIRWHDLRHTNATLLLEGGVDMKTLQERLGHSLMQTTSDIYSHVTEKMNRKATDVISNILKVK